MYGCVRQLLLNKHDDDDSWLSGSNSNFNNIYISKHNTDKFIVQSCLAQGAARSDNDVCMYATVSRQPVEWRRRLLSECRHQDIECSQWTVHDHHSARHIRAPAAGPAPAPHDLLLYPTCHIKPPYKTLNATSYQYDWQPQNSRSVTVSCMVKNCILLTIKK